MNKAVKRSYRSRGDDLRVIIMIMAPMIAINKPCQREWSRVQQRLCIILSLISPSHKKHFHTTGLMTTIILYPFSLSVPCIASSSFLEVFLFPSNCISRLLADPLYIESTKRSNRTPLVFCSSSTGAYTHASCCFHLFSIFLFLP